MVRAARWFHLLPSPARISPSESRCGMQKRGRPKKGQRTRTQPPLPPKYEREAQFLAANTGGILSLDQARDHVRQRGLSPEIRRRTDELEALRRTERLLQSAERHPNAASIERLIQKNRRAAAQRLQLTGNSRLAAEFIMAHPGANAEQVGKHLHISAQAVRRHIVPDLKPRGFFSKEGPRGGYFPPIRKQ